MRFDYIIIGAGSAGCVLANRLSKDKNNKVAVFEAGGSSDIWKVKMPLALLYTMHDPKYNWKYYSEPEPYLNNRRLFCPRGKMIGGSSAHNGMVFVRGNKNESKKFEKKDFFKQSIKLRKFDEAAKRTDIKIKSIIEYKDLLSSQLL